MILLLRQKSQKMINSLRSSQRIVLRYVQTTSVFEGMMIPANMKNKVVSASDAVDIICSNDTVCVSGFVSQGSPDAILQALRKRYEKEGQPQDLTLLFGGGPGDWGKKGLNHLARVPSDSECATSPMIKRAIGAHYGQTPELAALAISNSIEAWTLPLGSISRMIRAQATHSPGHITTVGMGTYVDPQVGVGGAVNDLAQNSPLHKSLVTRFRSLDQDYLMYKALPIQVAIIRATTADSSGNLSFEDESLFCDQKITCMAARNSGGVVIAQVKQLCAVGSLPTRKVHIPGAMVDCVVVVDEEDHDTLHPMSFESKHNPVLTSQIKTPADELKKMPLTERKIIARRASFALKPDKCINLGIGLPEGVAAVAFEEGMLKYVTLTTEPGVFGGLPASGRQFGPASNADALIEMNQMFDFYDGGGLDQCFLGAAQINARGDVNVSRLSSDRLTGPGGFIDISQSTHNVCFLSTFTAMGMKLEINEGKLRIASEGKAKKFVSNILETTFSGDEAVRRGQKVFYVTERAVFRRSALYDKIELIEIAPGIDLQKDVLDQMEFEPVVSPYLKEMDKRIFLDRPMGRKLFGSLDERLDYDQEEHMMYLNLFGVSLNSEADVNWFISGLDRILETYTKEKGKLDMVVNYDGFDLKSGLEDLYKDLLEEQISKKHQKSVKRFGGKAFRRHNLAKKIDLQSLDFDTLFDMFDVDRDGAVSPEELRNGMRQNFCIHMTPQELHHSSLGMINKGNFKERLVTVLQMSGKFSDE